MSLLSRLFKRRRPAGKADDGTPLRARELQACTQEAERLVASGRHDDALREAEAGLLRFPTSTRLRRIVQYVKREKSNSRVTQLKRALEESKDEGAYRELTAVYLDLNRVDAASECATRYLEEFPDSAEASVTMGEVQLASYFTELFSKDAWSAIEHLERATELNPECIRAHMLLGLVYYAIGAHHHAANALNEVLQLDPVNTRVGELREQLLAQSDGDEDIFFLLENAEEEQQLVNDPGDFPGCRKFAVESRGGTLDPKLFASAAGGIGRRLRIQQLSAIGPGGRALAVAGEGREQFVPLAVRLDAAARRAGRDMNFGTMRRFVIEGKFGRIVLVPAGNCAVAARSPRSVSANRIAEGLEMIVTASRPQEEE